MKTLVIHPADKSTDFLKKIYEDIENKTVLTTNLDYETVAEELQKPYDLIILCGHGWQGGLYDRINGFTAVNSRHAQYLKNKNVIGIWCNADEYFRIFHVDGLFATGMFISEMKEALDCDILTTEKEIEESSTIFANVMKTAMKTPEKIKEIITESYVAPHNPVVKVNRQFMNIDSWDD